MKQISIVWENGNGTYMQLDHDIDSAIKQALRQFDMGWKDGVIRLVEYDSNGRKENTILSRKACSRCTRERFEQELRIFKKLATQYIQYGPNDIDESVMYYGA